MLIKNYTTTIPADRSVFEIQYTLINKLLLAFSINMARGQTHRSIAMSLAIQVKTCCLFISRKLAEIPESFRASADQAVR
jgi:hypothetical protein